MSSSFVIKVPPKRHYGENKWIRFQLLEWISFALLVTFIINLSIMIWQFPLIRGKVNDNRSILWLKGKQLSFEFA